jgi:hypothetical protein
LPATATLVTGQTLAIPFAVNDREAGSSPLQVRVQSLGAGKILSSFQVIGDGVDRALVLRASAGVAGTQSLVVSATDTAGAVTQQIVLITVVGPRLQISREGGELVIICAEAPQGGEVEFTYSLGTSEVWRPLGYVPIQVGELRVVRIPVPARGIFFRLRY